jgi:branched-subunit amino acid transport protein
MLDGRAAQGREREADMSSTDLNVTDAWTLWVIVGLAIITVVTRSFFFLSNTEWHLPHWAQRGLQYAPIAALSAVVVPEIVMTQGELIATWQDARIFAAIVGVAVYFAKRNVLLTIVLGMAVYLPLHMGLGW